MSMDDQFREMKAFLSELTHFNEQLRESSMGLRGLHDSVSPLWQDEMRGSYDVIWQPLEDSIQKYLNAEAPRYVEFLSDKTKVLGRYLRGG
jgi:hypothetical protein